MNHSQGFICGGGGPEWVSTSGGRKDGGVFWGGGGGLEGFARSGGGREGGFFWGGGSQPEGMGERYGLPYM